MYSISLLPKPAIPVYRECTSIVKVAWFAVYIFGNLLVVVQKTALGGSGNIGVVYIIGAPHPELLPKKICQEPPIFDRLNNQADSKWTDIISIVIYIVFIYDYMILFYIDLLWDKEIWYPAKSDEKYFFYDS